MVALSTVRCPDPWDRSICLIGVSASYFGSRCCPEDELAVRLHGYKLQVLGLRRSIFHGMHRLMKASHELRSSLFAETDVSTASELVGGLTIRNVFFDSNFHKSWAP